MALTSQKQLEEAKAMRAKGLHEQAFDLAEAVTVSEPTNADAWWVAGLAAQSLNRLDDSLVYLKETIKLAPRWAPGWAQVGVVLIQNGQSIEGKKAFNQALRVDPNHVFSHRQLAKVFGSEKNYDGQIRHLLRLIDIDESDGEDLNQLGIAYWNKKQFWQAVEYYLKSGKATSGPAAYFNASLVYSHNEISQDVDAVDCLKRALKRNNKYEDGIKELKKLSAKLSKLSENVLEIGQTFLKADEYFQFYLNPLELLGIPIGTDVEQVDSKKLALPNI